MENNQTYEDQWRQDEGERRRVVNIALAKRELKEMRLEMTLQGYPLWAKNH